jgi:hypothetical protein
MVVDALSRWDTEAFPEAAATAALSRSSFSYIDDICSATAGAPDGQLLQERLRAGKLATSWHEDAGLLLHGVRAFVT